jgi:hypothetical protein
VPEAVALQASLVWVLPRLARPMAPYSVMWTWAGAACAAVSQASSPERGCAREHEAHSGLAQQPLEEEQRWSAQPGRVAPKGRLRSKMGCAAGQPIADVQVARALWG